MMKSAFLLSVDDRGMDDPPDMTFRPISRTTSTQSLSNLSRLTSLSVSTDFTRGPTIMDQMEERIRENVSRKLKSLQVPGSAGVASGSCTDLPTIIHTRSRSVSTNGSRDNMADEKSKHYAVTFDADGYSKMPGSGKYLVTGSREATEASRGRAGLPNSTAADKQSSTNSVYNGGMRGASSMSNIFFSSHQKSSSTPVEMDYTAKPPPPPTLVIKDLEKASDDLDQKMKSENDDAGYGSLSKPESSVSKTTVKLSTPSSILMSSSQSSSSLTTSPTVKTVQEKSGSVETLLSHVKQNGKLDDMDTDIKFGTKLNIIVPNKSSGRPVPPVAPKPAGLKNKVIEGNAELTKETTTTGLMRPYETSKSKSSDNIYTELSKPRSGDIQLGYQGSTSPNIKSNSELLNVNSSESKIPTSPSKLTTKSILHSRISDINLDGINLDEIRKQNEQTKLNGHLNETSNTNMKEKEVDTLPEKSKVLTNGFLVKVADKKEERYTTSTYISLSPARATVTDNQRDYHDSNKNINDKYDDNYNRPASLVTSNNSNNSKANTSNHIWSDAKRFGNNKYNGDKTFVENNKNKRWLDDNDSKYSSSPIRSPVTNNSPMRSPVTNNSPMRSPVTNSSPMRSPVSPSSNLIGEWCAGSSVIDTYSRPMRVSHTPSDSIISSDSGIERSTIGGHSDPDMLDDLDSMIPECETREGMYEAEMERIERWVPHEDYQHDLSSVSQMALDQTAFNRWRTDATNQPNNETYSNDKNKNLNDCNNSHENEKNIKNKTSTVLDNTISLSVTNKATSNNEDKSQSNFSGKLVKPNTDLEYTLKTGVSEREKIRQEMKPHINGSIIDARRRKFEQPSETEEKRAVSKVEIPPWRDRQSQESRSRDLAFIYGQGSTKSTATLPSKSPSQLSFTTRMREVDRNEMVSTSTTVRPTINLGKNSQTLPASSTSVSATAPFTRGTTKTEHSELFARVQPSTTSSIKSNEPIKIKTSISASSIISKLNANSKQDLNSPIVNNHISNQLQPVNFVYTSRARSRSTNNLLDTDVNHFDDRSSGVRSPAHTARLTSYDIATAPDVTTRHTDDVTTRSDDNSSKQKVYDVTERHTNDVTPRYRSLSSSTLLDENLTQDKTVLRSSRAFKDGVEMDVVLMKGPLGVGFCIEGGVGSPEGDKPVRVKRLFKGDTPARGILLEGDEILSVNDQPISGYLSQFRAWNYLKTLPDGPANFKIRRSNI